MTTLVMRACFSRIARNKVVDNLGVCLCGNGEWYKLMSRAAYCHLGGDTIQFAIQVQQYAIRFAISELL